ncbi:MAG: NAD-dependent epimerase/dehydratase family protein [Bacteroidota bacterium]
MILVTGGTGLLGSHLLFDLVKDGTTVTAIKREESSLSPVEKTFSYYHKNPESILKNIIWVDGDVTDIYSLYETFEGVEKVYHAAACLSFDPSDKKQMMLVNASGTANVVNACLKKNIKKLCYVSSIATLGRMDHDGLIDEETHWKNSKKNSVYSISKYNAECEVWRGIAEGLPAAIVNPGVIIGPGNPEKGSSRLIDRVWNGLKFYTPGVNGYVDVRDVSKAMIELMESNITSERFVLTSENIDYLTFFSYVAEALGKKKPGMKASYFAGQLAWRFEKIHVLLAGGNPLITKETARTAYQKYFYSSEKIKKILNFKFMPMEQSIKDTCKLFLKGKGLSQ